MGPASEVAYAVGVVVVAVGLIALTARLLVYLLKGRK